MRGEKKMANVFLVHLAQQMRVLLRRLAPRYYQENPEARRPCATCAFRPATDRMRGRQSTWANFAFAVRDGIDFHCHVGTAWRKPIGERTADELAAMLRAPLCAGFAAMKGDPGVQAALQRAAAAARKDMGMPS